MRIAATGVRRKKNLPETQQAAPKDETHRVTASCFDNVALRLDNRVAVPFSLRELTQDGEVHPPGLVCELVHLFQPLHAPLGVTALA